MAKAKPELNGAAGAPEVKPAPPPEDGTDTPRGDSPHQPDDPGPAPRPAPNIDDADRAGPDWRKPVESFRALPARERFAIVAVAAVIAFGILISL